MWIDKKTVARNFSRYANLYDRYAGIQRVVAHELMKEVPSSGVGQILEIGCGTAYYTRLLKERFSAAYIKAIDISREMIRIAERNLRDERVDFVIADAENMELEDKFDLVTSNAALQWLGSLESAVSGYKSILKENGSLIFSIFGPMTFWELRRALGEFVKQGDAIITANNFVNKEILIEMLNNYFTKISIKEIMIKEKYSSLAELLNKIKYTGARGNGWNRTALRRRDSFAMIEDAYKLAFGKIEASYQIFFCKAKL